VTAGPPPAATPEQVVTAVPGTPDEKGWVRLHPLTPLLRGARFGILLLAFMGTQTLRQESPYAPLAVLLAGVLIGGAFAYVSWRVMRYRLTSTELQVESGVLTRRSRRVPLARLQTVDVVRPLFARALGLAELRLEVAGGGDTEAPLAYLSEDDAHRLRVLLLELASGRREETSPGGAPRPPEAPEQVLVVVPPGPLLGSVLLGGPLVTAVVVLPGLALVGLIAPEVAGALVFGLLPVLFGVAAAAIRRVLTEYGFSVSESADGLRIRHGLLETRSATIPPGRVQIVRVREPWLWRPFGWVRVEVDVAGYAAGGGESQATTSALLPVAPRQLGAALVARVLGDPLPVADRPAPAAARWRVPVQAPRLHVGVDDRHVVSCYGILTRVTDVVPLAKVQSLRLFSGPWQRWLGLASLRVDTAGRRLPGTLLQHRDKGEIEGLLAELVVRARRARTGAAPVRAASGAGAAPVASTAPDVRRSSCSSTAPSPSSPEGPAASAWPPPPG
jgi:putative membrane protein